MFSTIHKRFLSTLLVCGQLLFPICGFCLQDFLFTVEQPKFLIYPQTISSFEQKQPSTLLIISRDIAKASYYEKQEYIEIVLFEMINVYQQEAERAIERAQMFNHKKKASKLYRWSQNASDYAEQLGSLYESINHNAQLDIYTDNDQSYLLINNYPVEISSPVLNQQQFFEDRIVAAICSQMICDMERLGNYTHLSQRRIRVRAGWRLQKDHYVFYTSSGLQFVFETIENKKIKQKMALKIAADMTLLAEELGKIQEKGVFIDWQHLHIEKQQTSSSYAVVINPLGDRIVLPLMLLHSLSDFPKKLLPWFKARTQRPVFEYIFADADSILKKLYH